MKKSFINYQTLSINMIPQREFIQKNIHSHYRLGHMKSVDLLSNINETISLELLALDELSKYYSAYAKSKYYTGIKKMKYFTLLFFMLISLNAKIIEVDQLFNKSLISVKEKNIEDKKKFLWKN